MKFPNLGKNMFYVKLCASPQTQMTAAVRSEMCDAKSDRSSINALAYKRIEGARSAPEDSSVYIYIYILYMEMIRWRYWDAM